MLIVADETGVDGNLVAAIVNARRVADAQHRVRRGSQVDETIRVPANTTVSLGTDETDPLLLEGIDTQPGADSADVLPVGRRATASCSTSPCWTATLDYLAIARCPDARRPSDRPLEAGSAIASGLEAVAESAHRHEHRRLAGCSSMRERMRLMCTSSVLVSPK